MADVFSMQTPGRTVFPIVLLILFSCLPFAAQTPHSELVARAKRAVVLITTFDADGQPEKQGSGFLLAKDRVATNSHVVETASRIRITSFNGKTVFATSVVAMDKTSDLALLQLSEPFSEATPLELADVTPAAGQSLLLVSNPAGARGKVSFGVVGPSWKFVNFGERMQITAQVAPGSSGAPVVNFEGRVIGIAVMHVEGTENLSFAIPVARLRSLQSGVDVMLTALAKRRLLTPLP
jgi:putative serine protease PepD